MEPSKPEFSHMISNNIPYISLNDILTIPIKPYRILLISRTYENVWNIFLMDMWGNNAGIQGISQTMNFLAPKYLWIKDSIERN
jgi:hypothetical protein